MNLSINLGGITYAFRDLKELFAKANEQKSGDELAGIAAETVQERIAAKAVLSDILLKDIRENPLIPYEEDEVSRLLDEDLNEPIYNEIQHWSVAELREYILRLDVTNTELRRMSKGLTSEMIAAVTKLMSNMDLVYAANKIEIITTCNITIGQKGTLSSRLQPNHPTDNIDGIMASLKEGLAYGVGDAVIVTQQLV